MTQSAGLAPTRPLKTAPSGEPIEPSGADTVKQNLLKQELSGLLFSGRFVSFFILDSVIILEYKDRSS